MQDSDKGADVYGTDMADSKGGDDMMKIIMWLWDTIGECQTELLFGFLGGLTGGLIVAFISVIAHL